MAKPQRLLCPRCRVVQARAENCAFCGSGLSGSHRTTSHPKRVIPPSLKAGLVALALLILLVAWRHPSAGVVVVLLAFFFGLVIYSGFGFGVWWGRRHVLKPTPHGDFGDGDFGDEHEAQQELRGQLVAVDAAANGPLMEVFVVYVEHGPGLLMRWIEMPNAAEFHCDRGPAALRGPIWVNPPASGKEQRQLTGTEVLSKARLALDNIELPAKVRLERFVLEAQTVTLVAAAETRPAGQPTEDPGNAYRQAPAMTLVLRGRPGAPIVIDP